MQIRQRIDQWKKHMKYKSISLEGDSDLPEKKYFNVETQASDNLLKKAHLHDIKNTHCIKIWIFLLKNTLKIYQVFFE